MIISNEALEQAAVQLTAFKVKEGFSLTKIFKFSDTYGQLRFDHSHKGKCFFHISFNGTAWVLRKPDFPNGSPLYLSPNYSNNPGATIYIVEGMGKVDALAKLGLVAVTSGSATSANATDWNPLFGRNVIIWPDNDPAGTAYAKDVAAKLCAMCCHVQWIDVPKLNLPEKGDCVDWLEAHPGAMAADIQALSMIAPPIDVSESGKDGDRIAISLSILSYTDLLKLELPQRKLILPWFPTGGLGMVAALRGVGKTYFGMSLAVAVATGKKFMKWQVENPCGVLYIDGEMAIAESRERLSSFDSSIPNVAMLSHEIFFKEHQIDLSITDKLIQNAILYHLDNNPGIGLLIVDNLSCLAGIREDKSDDWRECVSPFLIACRRRGVAVLMVHHANKQGDQRGTNAREDQLDVSIMLRPIVDQNNEGAHFKVEFTKSRGAYGDIVDPFTAKLVKDENGLFVWAMDDADAPARDRLLNLVRSCGHDGITVSEAAEDLDVTTGTISKAKQKLIESGDIRMVGKGKGAQMVATRYAIVSAPAGINHIPTSTETILDNNM